ncbi:MAG: FecR domain-containing protein [Gammaproteobacteria bacterium]|nr:FecR domain-containing protein [Gammaproteobacteria bacterium]
MRFIFIALWMVLSSTSAWAAEKAGQVIFVAGSVAVERGESIKLKKTDPIFEGDIIVTAAKSRGQLLMKDGAKFSLKAKTRFAVEEYFLAGDEREQDTGGVVVASNNGAVTNLIKGGFRTISGTIGKVDPEEYVVKSPAATMGIRGTHYSAVWCAGDCALAANASDEEIPDGLYVGVTDGVIAISNLSGEYTVGAGEYYYVQDFDSTPVRLPKPPSILGDSADTEEAAEEESDEDADEAAEESSEESDESGDESSEESSDESSDSSDESSETAESSESTESSDETVASSSDESSAAADETSAQQAEAAAEIAETAAAIGDSAESVGLGSSGSGDETDTSGFSARSTTPPGSVPGESGGDSAEDASTTSEESSEESSDESSEESSADVSDDSSAGSGDSDGTVASTDGSGSSGSGSSGSGSSGSGAGSTGGSTGSTGTSGGGFGDPGGFGGGGFGDSGGFGGGSTGSTSSEPPIPITTESGETIESGNLPSGRAVAHGSGPVAGLSTTVFTGASVIGERSLSGNDLTAFQAPPTSNDSAYAIGNSSTRDDGFHAATGIGWGRWTGGTSTVTQSNGTLINLNLTEQSLHWIYGPQAAPVIPTTGTASYSLIVGNTDPTDTIGNSGILGSASLQANFTNATVQSDVSLAIAGNVWEASGSGSISDSLFNGVYNSLLIDGQSGGSGNFSGFFGSAGSNNLPNGAGLTYGLSNSQGNISVSGAVIFGQPSP